VVATIEDVTDGVVVDDPAWVLVDDPVVVVAIALVSTGTVVSVTPDPPHATTATAITRPIAPDRRETEVVLMIELLLQTIDWHHKTTTHLPLPA
jgi:hypothetical protein